MKKATLFYSALLLLIANANGQLKVMQSKDQPVTLKPNNTLASRKMPDQFVQPGAFAGTTPVIPAPADPLKNNVSLFRNTAPNAYSDDPNTKYICLDVMKEGKDRLLVFTPRNINSQVKIGRNNAGAIGQMGSYSIHSDLKYTDELLTGNFSEEWGASVVVVDRRSNQFWRYRHDPTSGIQFVNPYGMLVNWAPADRYLSGDFNGDGKTDLLGWNHASNQFQVALYAKSATPGMPPIFSPAGVWLFGWAQANDMNIVTGDFNGDRKDDIALVHQPTGEWRVALSTGTAFQGSTGYSAGVWLKPWAVGTHHKIAALDVNNDGKCDLVEYNYHDKSFQAVLSNGQYFDYSFKREYIGNTITALKQQVAIGKFEGNCMVVVSHELPPDANYLHPRPTASVYITSYRR
ncbi:MAG TPA: VCBS repeat-containing protein [Chitinophagaceae bacterium]|nr:VCBS repeat-containing protein [Chitinophagaceae bacterium]